MFAPPKLSLAVLLTSFLLLAACGQKGPLILAQPSPEQKSGQIKQDSVKPAAQKNAEQQSTEAQ